MGACLGMFMDMLGICWNNGKENGNYCIMGYVGDIWIDAKETGNYSIKGYIRDIFKMMEKKIETTILSLQEDKQASRS